MELESLNKNADLSLISNTDSSPLGNDSEIEIVADTTKCHLTLLQIPSSSSTENALMFLSSHSNASTNNTDICVIDESHYGDANDHDQRHCFQHIDAPDFTVLHAPGSQIRFGNLCNFDESTEVLDMMSSECNRKSSNPCSGTDSDVEVLMSEEVGDSDWSAGVAAGLMDELERTPQNMESQDDVGVVKRVQSTIANHSLTSVTTTSPSVHHQESTDHDISVEEFSHSSAEGNNYEHLNRSQLLNLVNEQAVHIRRQDRTIERYRNAQQKLLQHIDTFRKECAASPTKPFDGSHETIP